MAYRLKEQFKHQVVKVSCEKLCTLILAGYKFPYTLLVQETTRTPLPMMSPLLGTQLMSHPLVSVEKSSREVLDLQQWLLMLNHPQSLLSRARDPRNLPPRKTSPAPCLQQTSLQQIKKIQIWLQKSSA